MVFFQTRDVISSESLRLVEELWWKAGLLEFVRDKVPWLTDAIISWKYYTPVERQEMSVAMKKDANPIEKQVLLRSSHPDDVTAYIGRLPTTSLSWFKPSSFTDTSLDNYAHRLSIRWPNHTGILVVPKKELAFRGSIVEHPNQPWVYIISEAFEIDNQTLCTSSIRWQDGEVKAKSYIKPAVDIEMAQKIIRYYLQSRESGWLNDDMTGQMEFWVDARTGKVYIFQFRAFRKKEISNWKQSWVLHKYVFWLTEEEWETFVLKNISGWEYENFQENEGMFRSQNYGNIHRNIPLEKLWLFVSSPRNALSLEHDVYEACMYTRIAILWYYEFDEQSTSIPENIEVFSDGRTAKIINKDKKPDSFDVLLAQLRRN